MRKRPLALVAGQYSSRRRDSRYWPRAHGELSGRSCDSCCGQGTTTTLGAWVDPGAQGAGAGAAKARTRPAQTRWGLRSTEPRALLRRREASVFFVLQKEKGTTRAQRTDAGHW